MDQKPIFELKRLGHKVHLAAQELAKVRGVDFMAGPQGRAAFFLNEKGEELMTIKDIERELDISKSVASNLVKRMEKNGFVDLVSSPSDGRVKYVVLTDLARENLVQVQALFEELDRGLMDEIEPADFEVFLKVMKQFECNVEKMKG